MRGQPRLWVLALVAIGLVAAGCGDDESDENAQDQPTEVAVPGAEEAAAFQADIGDLGDEEQVTAVGVQGALTGSSKLQASFGRATIDTVNVDGDTATAEFSNGEQVTFARDPDGVWKISETPRAS